MTKPIREWMNELPAGYREEALAKMINPDMEVECMADAIDEALISRGPGKVAQNEKWLPVVFHYEYGDPLPDYEKTSYLKAWQNWQDHRPQRANP